MALFETDELSSMTFKEAAFEDIDSTFFDADEHAEEHTVDGVQMLIVMEEDQLRQHSAHWEAGAKQNFDTGLYDANTILYVKASDYGQKPKVGKALVIDQGTAKQRSFLILRCREESGVYRMTLTRVRQ